ncbi:hypothetical protein Bca52824_071482 [Brassica carinata]|uniref:Uncharacterized protein n=1 Tax=Brassica carinata TaxID=52824 RepID=A0A8X7Q7G8_BRACI|nr:hypothetical protein Bca52824_071482 [Brassica carinata]
MNRLAPLVKKVGEEHIAAEGKSKYDGVRGIISDKWSMRILWDCALGSAVGNILYNNIFFQDSF